MTPAAGAPRRKLIVLSAAAAVLFGAGLLISFLLAPANEREPQAVPVPPGTPAAAMSSEIGFGPELANDAAGGATRWESPMPFGAAWWRTDLGGDYRISRIDVQVPSGAAGRYAIESSLDGSRWHTIAATDGGDAGGAVVAGGASYEVIAIARHIRISFVRESIGQTAQLSDVQVFGTPAAALSEAPVEVANARTDSGLYAAGSRVRLSAVLRNPTDATQTASTVTAKIFGMSRPDFLTEIRLPSLAGLTLAPGASTAVSETELWTIPGDLAPGAYGIALRFALADGRICETDATFFRVGDAADLTVYGIEETAYDGLPVFMLDGGMSAEYAVEKAAEALEPALSHSWFTSRSGFGPNPVYATPSFLADAIQGTVDFYNERYGPTRKFDTVVIATGVASVPYLSRAMHAPVLPLQYLASLDSVRELQALLDESARRGLPAFSTLGYDASMNPAVAWLKLLDLPDAYADFLNDHQVGNVVIMGSFGNVGESVAKKLLPEDGVPSDAMRPGDIYIMYPAGGTSGDAVQLGEKISDLSAYRLDDGFRSISDWESGVSAEQLLGISASIKARTGAAAVDFVAGRDTLHLYEFASHITLAYYKKNEALLTADGGPAVRGVALNPYLVSHPFYETRMGEIPLLFWQFGNLRDTVDVRLNRDLRREIARYFPDVRFEDLRFRIGTSNNFGKSGISDRLSVLLRGNGLNGIEATNDLADEIWFEGDGMNAQTERLAYTLLSRFSASELTAWNDRLLPLTPDELRQAAERGTSITVTRQ